MKKYNCWEDLHESFCPVVDFECEGERFHKVKFETFPNNTTIRGVNIINIAAGVIIRIYYENVIDQFTYYAKGCY